MKKKRMKGKKNRRKRKLKLKKIYRRRKLRKRKNLNSFMAYSVIFKTTRHAFKYTINIQLLQHAKNVCHHLLHTFCACHKVVYFYGMSFLHVVNYCRKKLILLQSINWGRLWNWTKKTICWSYKLLKSVKWVKQKLIWRRKGC